MELLVQIFSVPDQIKLCDPFSAIITNHYSDFRNYKVLFFNFDISALEPMANARSQLFCQWITVHRVKQFQALARIRVTLIPALVYLTSGIPSIV